MYVYLDEFCGVLMPWSLSPCPRKTRSNHRTCATTLFACKALPVARCKSAIDLFKSVWARNSLPFAVVKAVCRSRTRKRVDWPASNLRCSLEYCCSEADRATAADLNRDWEV